MSMVWVPPVMTTLPSSRGMAQAFLNTRWSHTDINSNDELLCVIFQFEGRLLPGGGLLLIVPVPVLIILIILHILLFLPGNRLLAERQLPSLPDRASNKPTLAMLKVGEGTYLWPDPG